ncbi:MAG TPA: TMEM143 family protein [Gammaproteobacteria bacterium]|nr:TMEM143 family protein [Gammaproteobacteria bacterium]
MTSSDTRFRFIPFRRHDIVEMCLHEVDLAQSEADFRRLAQLLAQIFHFEFHALLEALEASYTDLDPDVDTRRVDFAHGNEQAPFVELLDGLLEKANYERISKADLNQALNESSLFKIRLHVDFADFAEVSLFARGQSQRSEVLPTWFGLGSRHIEFTNFDRVVVFLKIRDDYQNPTPELSHCRAGATLLKLFRNVPRADLEMLFPNTRVRMRLMDKLFIGVPALVSGGIVFTTKLGASLVLLGSLFGYWLGLHDQPAELNQAGVMVLLAGAATLAGYLWKQFSNFKNRKIRFMQALTQNLYFKNLDNNAGVFLRLINDAEAEESKEALLAYYFLLISPVALAKAELDRQIESWFEARWNCSIDFEVGDALHKLRRLGLVKESAGELTAVDLVSAISLLDKRWDNYFVPEN